MSNYTIVTISYSFSFISFSEDFTSTPKVFLNISNLVADSGLVKTSIISYEGNINFYVFVNHCAKLNLGLKNRLSNCHIKPQLWKQQVTCISLRKLFNQTTLVATWLNDLCLVPVVDKAITFCFKEPYIIEFFFSPKNTQNPIGDFLSHIFFANLHQHRSGLNLNQSNWPKHRSRVNNAFNALKRSFTWWMVY